MLSIFLPLFFIFSNGQRQPLAVVNGSAQGSRAKESIMRTTNRLITGLSMLAATLSACGGAGSPAFVSGVSVPERQASQQSVTKAFGPLIVREGEVDGSADRTPWSGSWLPLKSSALFESDHGLAPLQKYDRYVDRAHGQTSHAADTEKSNPELYDPNALGWEGRCDAWAAASVLEDEPTRPVTLNGVTFSVSDQKSLLIKTYENSNALKQFGHNFEPSPDADFNQIYPDQFHRAVQHEVLERHQLIVFDNDSTEQVWNTPLYRAMFEIHADAHDEHVMHAVAYIWGASPFIPDPDYVGTISVKYIYTYDLYGDRQPDGAFRVAFGEWTGDSKIEHPNFVSVLTGSLDHSSNNTEINTGIVKEILSQARNQNGS